TDVVKAFMLLVLASCGSEKEAAAIGEMLVKERLAACAQVLGGVRSVFFWKGKLAKRKEALLLLKVAGKDYPRVEREIKRAHSYEVPEIVAFKVGKGYAPYLRWVGG
ncbi:cytochrome C biogenesis protein CcdA, partial [Candidatus Micrarchaeota archaeon CG08_land_8_20_14_0_20_59_11]